MMINEVVTDLVDHSKAALAAEQPKNIDAVRGMTHPLVDLSPETTTRHRDLKKFLAGSLYQHELVLAMTDRADAIVRGLFEAYMHDIHAMPRDHASRALEWGAETGESGLARAVADYVAGMTDRYAYSEYRRLVKSDAAPDRASREKYD